MRALALAALLAPALAGCLSAEAPAVVACPEDTAHAAGAFPDCVVANGLAHLAQRLGPDFVAERASLNESLSRYHDPSPYCAEGPESCPDGDVRLARPFYALSFDLAFPELGSEPMHVELGVNAAGERLFGAGPDVLPDCRTKPGECYFTVDRERALDLAREAGLEDRGAPWDARMGLAGGPHAHREPTFAWHVTNVRPQGLGCTDGETAVLDANTGQLVHVRGWSRCAD